MFKRIVSGVESKLTFRIACRSEAGPLSTVLDDALGALAAPPAPGVRKR
jgi:hypothetical protein